MTRGSTHCVRTLTALLLSFGMIAVWMPTYAQADTAVARCSKRIAKGLKSYSAAVAKAYGECEVEDLEDEEEFYNCSADESVGKDIEKAGDKLWREVKKCREAPLRAVCPLGGKDIDGFVEAAATGPYGPGQLFPQLFEDIFKAPLNPSCSRPAGRVSKDAETCADRLMRIVEDVTDDAQKCLYKCELANLRSSYREPCLEPETNLPKPESKLSECLTRAFRDLEDEVRQRCMPDEDEGPENGLILELGCPFGQTEVAPVVAILWDRLYLSMLDLNLNTFRSSCRSNIGGGGSSELEPARATLSPSQTEVEVRCGQVLDRAFFRGAGDERDDTELDFESHLDCGDATTATDGIVVAHSGVEISGREKWSIQGPGRSSLRSGFGIRIAAGVSDVKITNFRAIERFGIGVGDESGSSNLQVDGSGVRRNAIAGIRFFAERSRVEEVKADRNNIGIELSGEDSTIKDSRATRSEGPDGIGIVLGGEDLGGNGRVVRVTSCDVTENQGDGLHVVSGAQQVEESDFIGNGGAGLVIDGDGGKYESNSIKLNGTDGVVLGGGFNELTANRSDQNARSGYVITANAHANNINNNGAGTASHHGNGLHGFEIYAAFTFLDTNRAEANAQTGFHIAGAGTAIESNYAGENAGRGFDVVGAGNTLDTNVGEINGLFEFAIGPGNTDGSGNRANGATFTFESGSAAEIE